MPHLEAEQEELLRRLVEGEKSVPRHRREPFLATRYMGGQEIRHPGFSGEELKDFLWEDLDVLARYGLIISYRRDRGIWRFSVSPQGREYYLSLVAEVESATARIEEGVRRFFDADHFTKRHPAAYAAWQEAEANLWKPEDVREFANVAYLCPQALQESADSLARPCEPQKARGKAKTKHQVRRVIAERRPVLGERLAEVLNGLARCGVQSST